MTAGVMGMAPRRPCECRRHDVDAPDTTDAIPIRRSRSRLGIAMLVVAGLLIVGAAVFAVVGFQAQSKASDERDRTTAAVARRHTLASQEQGFDADLRDLEQKLLGLPDTYDAAASAFDGLADSHDAYVDLLLQSAELYNDGDTPGSVALLQGDGAAALADLMAKKTETQQTVQTAEDALHQILEGAVTDITDQTDTTGQTDRCHRRRPRRDRHLRSAGRLRWYHVAVLGVAVMVCAVAVGFSVSESSSRDEATEQREAAQAQLRAQRDSTDEARTKLLTERDETKATLEDIAVLTTSIHEFSDLAAQEVDTVAAAHQLAVTNPDAVDEYNAQVQRAAELLTQMEAKVEAIVAQADALRDETEAQLAAAISG